MTDEQIEAIARGLTKAQRFYIIEGPHKHWTPTRRALVRFGLVDVGGDITETGLAVRAYAGEAAWREDNRRVDNGGQAMKLVFGAMASRQSRTWAGYWQRAA